MVKRFFFISRTGGPFWCFVEREVKQRFSLFVFLRFFLLLEPPASSGVRKRRELESSNDFFTYYSKTRERVWAGCAKFQKQSKKMFFFFSLGRVYLFLRYSFQRLVQLHMEGNGRREAKEKGEKRFEGGREGNEQELARCLLLLPLPLPLHLNQCRLFASPSRIEKMRGNLTKRRTKIY